MQMKGGKMVEAWVHCDKCYALLRASLPAKDWRKVEIQCPFCGRFNLAKYITT